jgi:hypothetical protein
VAESIRSTVDHSGANLPVTAGVYDPDRRNAAICNQYFLNLPFHLDKSLTINTYSNIIIPFIQTILYKAKLLLL